MDKTKQILVMGIDGGGTSSRAVLMNSGGKVLGWGRAGSSNYDDVGVDLARENIRLAVDLAWNMSALYPRPVDAVFLGMAGVVSAADRAVIKGIAHDLHMAPDEYIGVDHDISIALAGGLALEAGIVLIAGTGSSCYGRTADGRDCRVGGWGHLLDDEGSAYYLALEAMRSVVRSLDGRMSETKLVGELMAVLNIQDGQDIMHRFYSPMMSRSQIAAMAPVVIKTAERGDRIAQEIVCEGQKKLARLVEVAARRLNFPPNAIKVTVTGGLMQSGDYFKQGLYLSISQRVAGINILEPILPPVSGAALRALQLLGESPSSEVISVLKNCEIGKV